MKVESRDIMPRRGRKRWIALRIGALLAAMGGITVLVYITGTSSAAIHFYYLPIIYAGFAFGDAGAVIAAAVATLLSGPWAPASRELVEGNWVVEHQGAVDILVRAGFFLVMGFFASRVSRALHKRVAESRTLYEVTSTVASSLRLHEVLELITTSALNVLDARACSIRLLDEESGELLPGAAAGLSGDYWSKGPVTVADSPLDQRVLAGEAVAVRNVQNDPSFQYPEAAREEGLTSVLSLPLISKDRPLGVIRIYARRQRDFQGGEKDLLRAFADTAALAIENAQLYEDIRVNYFETVRALTIAIEARDSATYSHSERVTELADKVAQELGMSNEEREMLRFGCILHDIGRIGIDERPSNLDDASEETLTFYRMHPLIGRSILQPVSFLQDALPIVLYHHERWDGKGFPEGLAGEDIPRAARLVAVVDRYERLMNPTENARPLDSRQALREVLRGSGTAFDPEMVAAFARSLGMNEAEDTADDISPPGASSGYDEDGE
ncbi:MAG: HD domain-containing protein [Armatimonadetes bacterium]|nr:HD domain-containing protein [Armatimonadota bacterium]